MTSAILSDRASERRVPGRRSCHLLAAFVAGNVRAAFLRPLFLIMVMGKFHVSVQNQPINLEWDARLSNFSDKFRELKGEITDTKAAPQAGVTLPASPA